MYVYCTCTIHTHTHTLLVEISKGFYLVFFVVYYSLQKQSVIFVVIRTLEM